MKHIYGLFFLFLFFDSIIFAQKDNDVVYLKDGSIIRGMIIEQSPNEYIKIKSGENVFVYEINEIEKMIKESIPDAKIEIKDLMGDNNHYSAKIKSKLFNNLSKIEQHKLVYKSLKGKMGNELHALSITTEEE